MISETRIRQRVIVSMRTANAIGERSPNWLAWRGWQMSERTAECNRRASQQTLLKDGYYPSLEMCKSCSSAILTTKHHCYVKTKKMAFIGGGENSKSNKNFVSLRMMRAVCNC